MTVPVAVNFSLFPCLHSVRSKVQGFILPGVNRPGCHTDVEVEGSASWIFDVMIRFVRNGTTSTCAFIEIRKARRAWRWPRALPSKSWPIRSLSHL